MSRRTISVVVAVLFAGVLLSFLVYTQQMVQHLRRDAEVISRVYANAFQGTATQDPIRKQLALSAIFDQSRRLTIPIVLTDSAGRPTSAANLPFEFDPNAPEDRERVRRYVERLDAVTEPYELPESNLQVHFGEPRFLGWLRWVPWLQAAVLVATVAGGGWLLYASFQGERERIWSAMARESAHQMGTPLSSLVGWLEQLRERGADALRVNGGTDLAREMEADVERLLKVSRRFELIGRSPEPEVVDVARVLRRLEEYFEVRLPTLGRSVRFEVEIPTGAPPVHGNETLLEWAFENLIKNSLDALAGREGLVRIRYEGTRDGRAVYRFEDTGPGVDPEVRKRLFEIGVTTKERGWGVGLSLTRRIVEEVHEGTIELEPEEREGACFRVELPVPA